MVAPVALVLPDCWGAPGVPQAWVMSPRSLTLPAHCITTPLLWLQALSSPKPLELHPWGHAGNTAWGRGQCLLSPGAAGPKLLVSLGKLWVPGQQQ